MLVLKIVLAVILYALIGLIYTIIFLKIEKAKDKNIDKLYTDSFLFFRFLMYPLYLITDIMVMFFFIITKTGQFFEKIIAIIIKKFI